MSDGLDEARDLLEAAADGMLSRAEALDALRRMGASEELLERLRGNACRTAGDVRAAGLLDWALRSCDGDRALMTAVLALFVSGGSLFGYTARSGDSLWKISRECKCTVDDLRKLNPQISGDVIRPGDIVVTPSEPSAGKDGQGDAPAKESSAASGKAQSSAVHVVSQGETLSQIARSRKVKLKDLLDANPQVKDPNMVRPGDVLALPSGAYDAKTDFVAKVIYAETSTKCSDEEAKLVARVIFNRIGDGRFGKGSNAYDVVSAKNAFSCTSGKDGNVNWSEYSRTLNDAARRDYGIAEQLMRGDSSGLPDCGGAVYYCNKSLAAKNAKEDSVELDGVKYGYPPGWESKSWKPVPVKATEHFVFYRVDPRR